jgi:hypothetical protein
MNTAHEELPVGEDGYETPALSEYGSIEEWTKGSYAQLVDLSIII